MTSKLTRERIELIANFHRAMALPPSHAEIEELARMALAAMDSEPVAYSLIFRNMDGALNNYINTNTTFATREKAEAYGKGGKYEMQSDGRLKWVPNTALDPVVVPLYRHAQQPVVMDDLSIFEAAIEECKTCDSIDERAWNHGVLVVMAKYDACRAAMIQAGTLTHEGTIQAVNPSVIPGWISVSERMPEVGDIVLTAMEGVVNVGEMECSAANCRFFTSVISGRELLATHWMPLPVGPKESK